MALPNTFIVGAPKCGTTALCHYLESHPNVFMCDPKEPHYFAHEDMPGRSYYYNNLDDYLALFDSAEKHQTAIVEGSIWYLFCENAIANIRDFSPEAKIVVMLRRPDEMVYSFHNQALGSFHEDITDFETAWRIATKKNKPRPIPAQCDDPNVLQYGQIAAYGTQLKRLLSIFPQEQILVTLFDDLTSDSHKFYDRVLDHLDVPSIHPPSFNKVNENKVVRNKSLGRLLTYPPKPLITAANSVKKVLGIKKLNLRDKMLDSLSRKVQRKPLNQELKKEIIDHYHEEIIITQNLINRDLSHWLK